MQKKKKGVKKLKVQGKMRDKNKMICTSPQLKVRRYKISTPSTAVLSSAHRARLADIRLVSSMDLDEMLEASNAIELGFRGEQIPVIISPKARIYARKALLLNKGIYSKKVAKQMQQNLVVKIIERNKRTTNRAKAEHLYHAIMKEV